MVETRRNDAPDIHDQYKTLMIALCNISEHEFPIRSYDTRRIVPDLLESEIAHRCMELRDKGYLDTGDIQKGISVDASPRIVVNRVTSYGRDYVAVVSNAKKWSKFRKWVIDHGLPHGGSLANIILKLFGN